MREVNEEEERWGEEEEDEKVFDVDDLLEDFDSDDEEDEGQEGAERLSGQGDEVEKERRAELNRDREMVLVALGGRPGLGNLTLSSGKNARRNPLAVRPFPSLPFPSHPIPSSLSLYSPPLKSPARRDRRGLSSWS